MVLLNKTGHIVGVKSHGKYYFYLRKSYRKLSKKGKNLSVSKRIYSFGNKDNSLKTLNEWIKDKNKVPKEILERGFGTDDFKKWLDKINQY